MSKRSTKSPVGRGAGDGIRDNVRITRGPQIAMTCASLAIFPLVIFGTLISTGQLTDGPRIADDNQIYRLRIEFAERGFFPVLATELSDRFHNMRRLCPVYSVQKVVQTRLFGGNLFIWSMATGLLGVCTAGLLYWFFRLCHGTVLASVTFALVTILGEQFVVWYRLLHGEGVGMLLLAAAHSS